MLSTAVHSIQTQPKDDTKTNKPPEVLTDFQFFLSIILSIDRFFVWPFDVHDLSFVDTRSHSYSALQGDLDRLMDSIASELKLVDTIQKVHTLSVDYYINILTVVDVSHIRILQSTTKEEAKEKSNEDYLKALDEIIKSTTDEQTSKSNTSSNKNEKENKKSEETKPPKTQKPVTEKIQKPQSEKSQKTEKGRVKEDTKKSKPSVSGSGSHQQPKQQTQSSKEKSKADQKEEKEPKETNTRNLTKSTLVINIDCLFFGSLLIFCVIDSGFHLFNVNFPFRICLIVN